MHPLIYVAGRYRAPTREAVAANIGAKVVTIDPLAENLPEMWRATAAALAASFEGK